MKAQTSRLGPSEPILLHADESLEILNDAEFPRVPGDLYTVFKPVTDDKHLWSYLQSERFGKHSGFVYYFRFRNDAGARECERVMSTSLDFGVPFMGRQFGCYTVLALHSSPDGDPPHFFENVFAQISENMNISLFTQGIAISTQETRYPSFISLFPLSSVVHTNSSRRMNSLLRCGTP
jgi:hypothetical protein